MVRRPHSTTPEEVERHNRTMQRVGEMGDAITERMEQLFEAQNDRLERIEKRVSAGEFQRDFILSEINELKLQQGQMRDLVDLRAKETTEAAAAVAGNAVKVAKTAASATARIVPEVRKAVTEAQPRSLPKTWWGWLLIAAAGIVTLSGALQGLPIILRFIEGVWLTTRGLK